MLVSRAAPWHYCHCIDSSATARLRRLPWAFIVYSDHIIDSDQSEELNAAHQMKYAILKTCVKEIQSKTLKQISQIAVGHYMVYSCSFTMYFQDGKSAVWGRILS